MRSLTSEANFRNDILRGQSSLFYEGHDNSLHPRLKYKECRIQPKYLIFQNLFNVQGGNFTVIMGERKIIVNIADGVYNYKTLFEVIREDLDNRISVVITTEEKKVKYKYKLKYTIENKEQEHISFVGQPFFFFVMGFIDYESALLDTPSTITLSAGTIRTFSLDLYKALSVFNIKYCNQNFFTFNLANNILFDNWMQVTDSIIIKPPSNDISIQLVDQMNSIITLKNILNVDIKSKYSQLKCTLTFKR